jgi:hypothetical protein
MNFQDTASRHLNRLASKVDLRPCPDQYVGEVRAIESRRALAERGPAEQRPQSQPCVLLILESPHIREFIGDPAPAKGPTGFSIATRLRSVPGLESVDSFGLLLMNAIQYQCSLGLPTTVARDDVFLEMWRLGGSENFIKRLKELFQPGDIVVNSCTMGKARQPTDQLRIQVQRAIESALPGAPVLRRTHPAAWHSKAHLEYEWPNAV